MPENGDVYNISALGFEINEPHMLVCVSLSESNHKNELAKSISNVRRENIG